MIFWGLPVTSGAVGVLEGRQGAPSDAMGSPHHPLESPAVVGGAVAVPGGDTARRDAFNCAAVKVCEGLRGQDKFLQPPEVEEALLRLHHTICVGGPFKIVKSNMICHVSNSTGVVDLTVKCVLTSP